MHKHDTGKRRAELDKLVLDGEIVALHGTYRRGGPHKPDVKGLVEFVRVADRVVAQGPGISKGSKIEPNDFSIGLLRLIPPVVLQLDFIYPTPVVEGRDVCIAFSLGNTRSERLDGWVMARIRTPGQTNFYDVAARRVRLEQFESLQDILSFVAPMAALGCMLELYFSTNGGGRETSTAVVETTFDIAARYRFTLDRFHAYNVRATRTDTIFAGAGVLASALSETAPNGFDPFHKDCGDVHDDDDVNTDLTAPGYIDLIPLTDEKPLFSYAILNLGQIDEKDAGTIANRVMLAFGLGYGLSANIAADEEWAFPRTSWKGFLSPLFPWFIASAGIYAILTLNCNGPVAADVVIFSGAVLRDAIAPGGKLSRSAEFFGEDSPVLCGSNSHYSASWSIARLLSDSGPDLTVKPKVVLMAPGETRAFQYLTRGIDPNFTTLSWTCDIGMISASGVFTAPAVSAQVLATITLISGPYLAKAFVVVSPHAGATKRRGSPR